VRAVETCSEIRFAARRLLQDRWSAAAAILVIALGTGLNTAVFTIAYAVLVRSLPYPDATRLAVVDVSVPFARLDEWRGQLSTFDRVAAYAREGFTVLGLAEPRFEPVAVVDDTFFETLGSPALAGRTFGNGDSAAIAVLSERVARQISGSIETVLGRSITVGERRVVVIGVMPDAFAFPSDGTNVWIPARGVPAIAFDRSSDGRRFRLFGRLKRGVTLAQAGQDLLRARQALEPAFKVEARGTIHADSLHNALVGTARPILFIFAGAAAIVLLIACANVATILIGRTVARQRELAVRSALGAGRLRLSVTILAESILIALAGAAIGTTLAVVAVRLVTAWAAGILPRLGDVRVDWSMLAFALVCAALSSVVAAAPALRTVKPAIATRAGAGGTPSRVRVRTVLAVSQITLAVVLLSAGALLTATIVRLLRADIGVEPHGVIVTQWMVTRATSFEAQGRQRWMDDVLQRVRAIPDAVAAGAGSSLPPDNVPIVVTARLVSGTRVTDTPELSLASVTPGYLEALGVRLLHGRYFESADERRSDLVTVLSESAARILIPDVNPVGRQLPIDLPAGMRGRGRATVLGVVADVKYTGLESSAGPAIYVLWKELPAGQIYLALRTRDGGLAAVSALRAVLRDADAAMPVMPIRRLDDVVQRSVADRRLRAFLGGSAGLLAVAIALVGVAGGLGRMVSERRHEFAIRAALGATPSRALRTVMIDGAIITATGIAAGMLSTLAMGSVLQSLVVGISPHDPATLMLVAMSVGGGSLLACYLPARRAAATNPLDMLRDD
jgi:putative ABC transport system permease protein